MSENQINWDYELGYKEGVKAGAAEENERLAKEFEALADKVWITEKESIGLKKGAELIRKLGEKR